MQKILIVGMTGNPGGMEAFLRNVNFGLKSKAISFDYLSTDTPIAFQNDLRCSDTSFYTLPHRKKHPIAFKKCMKDFFAINAAKYDAIWFNTCSLCNLLYLKYAMRYGIKRRIVHCHNSSNMEGFLSGLRHAVNKKFVSKYATDYWSCSDEASKWFFGEKIMRMDSYRVINNAIYPEHFAFDSNVRRKIRSSLSISDDAIVLGNVGRLHFQKNQSFLIRILEKLNNSDKKYYLLVVGEGELREELTDLARKLKVDNYLYLIGAVDETSIYYQAMDAFVFPSVFEGLPIAFLEAQANGLPCFVSDAVSREAVVNENVERLSIDEGDISKWVDSIRVSKLKRLSETENRMFGGRYDMKTQASAIAALLN